MDKEGFDSLSHAIVAQAIKDYRTAAQKAREEQKAIGELEARLSSGKEDIRVARKISVKLDSLSKARYALKEVASFFRSGWFEGLSDASGEYILRRLEAEARGPRQGG